MTTTKDGERLNEDGTIWIESHQKGSLTAYSVDGGKTYHPTVDDAMWKPKAKMSTPDEMKRLSELLMHVAYKGSMMPAGKTLSPSMFEDEAAFIEIKLQDAYDSGYADKAMKADEELSKMVIEARIDELDRYYQKFGMPQQLKTNLPTNQTRYQIDRIAELRGHDTTQVDKEMKQQNMRIGMMRQWLNENRIKDAERFVTNEELAHWLKPRSESSE